MVAKSSAGRITIQSKKQFETIDEYIETFPRDVQSILEKMRQTIRKAAPEAEETISYQMPTFKLRGSVLCILLRLEDTLGSSHRHPENSRMKYPSTRVLRAISNSPSTNRFLTIWLRESFCFERKVILDRKK